MEIFDLYTAERERTGRTMVRGDKTPEGLYRLVVHVCLFSPEGRMLIQRRQPFKHGWSGMWDVSVGGHADAGESSAMAARRETWEELGLKILPEMIRPVLTIHWEHGFDDFYTVTRDVGARELRLQAEEVAEVRWASREEILAMIDGGSFIPYEKSLISFLFFLKDHRSAHTRADRR